MKTKNIPLYSLIAMVVVTTFCSCKKKAETIDNYFLNYKIPEVPVTSDYTVGAFYYTFTTFNANIKDTPTVGKYTASTTGVIPANVIQTHIDQAAAARVDYLIFSLRSPDLDFNNYKIDSVSLGCYLSAPNASKVNFAVSYNLSQGTLGITDAGNPDSLGHNRGTPIEANATKLAGFYKDFIRLAYYMKMPNYQKYNGKPILIINNAYELNSNMDPNNPGSDAPLYAQIRKELSALGLDVYIIGMQSNWSVPNNYFFRYQNCLDALYEANMADTKNVLDRYYIFGPMVDQNFAYWKQELESWPAGGLTPGQNKMQFVPCIQAGYNYQITAPTSTSPSIVKSADWYRTYTNIAKRNASGKLVLIDSWNNFSVDTQIEPTLEYGTTYTDITRQEFKVPQ